jgi:hypothetical protein
VDGPDHALRGAVVADRLTRVLDPAVQRRRRHVAVAPDAIEQILLGDDPVTMREQVREHVEHLRLDVEALVRAAELVQPRIELVLAERVHRAFGPAPPA